MKLKICAKLKSHALIIVLMSVLFFSVGKVVIAQVNNNEIRTNLYNIETMLNILSNYIEFLPQNNPETQAIKKEFNEILLTYSANKQFHICVFIFDLLPVLEKLDEFAEKLDPCHEYFSFYGFFNKTTSCIFCEDEIPWYSCIWGLPITMFLYTECWFFVYLYLMYFIYL